MGRPVLIIGVIHQGTAAVREEDVTVHRMVSGSEEGQHLHAYQTVFSLLRDTLGRQGKPQPFLIQPDLRGDLNFRLVNRYRSLTPPGIFSALTSAGSLALYAFWHHSIVRLHIHIAEGEKGLHIGGPGFIGGDAEPLHIHRAGPDGAAAGIGNG